MNSKKRLLAKSYKNFIIFSFAFKISNYRLTDLIWSDWQFKANINHSEQVPRAKIMDLHLGVVAYEKGAFESSLTKVTNLTLQLIDKTIF